METMTKGKIYVTVNADGALKAITQYDKANKRYKQIDLIGTAHMVNGRKELPHSHIGYVHDENGTRAVSEREKKLIDKVKKVWNNRHSR